jgi:large subunit ribosomal protein L21
MYAVVKTGGRQYRVSPGDTIDVEKLSGEVGDAVTLTDVLLLGNGADITIGAPRLAEAWVEAQIVAQKRGKKIVIFKHKRRKGYRRKQGHRQALTSLQITGIHAAREEATPALATGTAESISGTAAETVEVASPLTSEE